MYLAPRAPSRSFRFEGFEVDARHGELRKDGERLHLQGVPFQVLEVLLEHPGELVTREELRRSIWPEDVHIDFDEAIATAVVKLRKALGDSSRNSRIIETLPGRGFRFLVEVETSLEGLPVQEPGWRRPRWAVLGGLTGCIALGTLVVAHPWPRHPVPSVLPLPARVHGEAGTEYLADAVPTFLSTSLAGIPGLETKVQPSTFEVEKVQWDLDRIAKAYGARNLLLSAITAKGGRVVLQVQLVDSATRDVRWARQYEGPLGELQQLASQAAEAMLPTLRPGGPAVAPARIRAASFGAEMALEEGRYYLNRYPDYYKPEDAERCRAALEKALALDPGCASAAATLAYLQVFRSWCATSPDQKERCLTEATAWGRRALGIDLSCGLAWAALAQAEAGRPQPEPEKVLAMALRGAWLSPRDPLAHQALGGAAGGSYLMAATGKHIADLNPLSAGDAAMGSLGLAWIGRPGEGLDLIDRALRFNGAPAPFPAAAKAHALIQLGRLEEAAATLAKAGQGSKDALWEQELLREVRFELAAAQGDAVLMSRLSEEILRKVLDPETGDPGLAANTCGFVLPGMMKAGHPEAVLGLLGRVVEGMGDNPFARVLRDPVFLPLRSDPRFEQILKAARQGNERTLRALEEARTRGELADYLVPVIGELKAELGI